ncbi:hypothetical protein BC829DRAFT_24279 [Chytridium lagenaria]|nr:hypothetical protein BC829DRAFT_24279 [Chytridium lagenaria]
MTLLKDEVMGQGNTNKAKKKKREEKTKERSTPIRNKRMRKVQEGEVNLETIRKYRDIGGTQMERKEKKNKQQQTDGKRRRVMIISREKLGMQMMEVQVKETREGNLNKYREEQCEEQY